MTEAEHTLRDAAANIPAEVCARFETADKLSDEDRKAIVDIARQSLARFQPKPESKPEPKVEPKLDAKIDAKPEAKAEPKADAKPKPEPETETETQPKPKADPKEKS
jgi:F-type H+-transporting ATPase subunit alpha